MLSCNTKKKNPQKLQLKSEGYNRFPTFPVVTKINALFCALFGLFIHQKYRVYPLIKYPAENYNKTTFPRRSWSRVTQKPETWSSLKITSLNSRYFSMELIAGRRGNFRDELEAHFIQTH